jgi:Tat protein secretion system quality control protein TatD with DNase activity
MLLIKDPRRSDTELHAITSSFIYNIDQDKRNIPSNVSISIASIAEIKGVSVQDVRKAIRANFRRLFQR